MKKIFILLGILIVLILALFGMLKITGVSAPKVSASKTDTYLIDGQNVKATYFGNEVVHDFNNDGRPDKAYLITYQPGGSGTFYYVVVTLDTVNGPVNSEAYFLGDRIAPQTTEMGGPNGNTLIVNYADRKLTDSFAVAPSVGKTVQLILDAKTMKFGVVVNNFEGEANPAQITLTQQKWNWVNTTYNDGVVLAPHVADVFNITFKEATANSGSFSASTDCNSMGGEYAVTGNSLTFSRIISTMRACQGSQEQDFAKELAEVGSFHFTSKGELVFDLKMDGGVMLFK